MQRPALPILRVQEDLRRLQQSDPEFLGKMIDLRVRLSLSAERQDPWIRAFHTDAADFPMVGLLEVLNTLLQPGDQCLAPVFDDKGQLEDFQVVECKRLHGECTKCGTEVHTQEPGKYTCPKCCRTVEVTKPV